MSKGIKTVAYLLIINISLLLFTSQLLTYPVLAQEIEWVRQYGTPGSDFAKSLATDSLGNIYVSNDVDSGLGGGGRQQDVMIRKYDSNGITLWVRQFSGTSSLFGLLDTDELGNVFVAGTSSGGSVAGEPGIGSDDGYVRKYDSNGNVIWTRVFGTPNSDFVFGVAADAEGNVYLGGQTAGTFPGYNYLGGYADIFIRKYDPDGNEVWTRQFGTTSDDWSRNLTKDRFGSVYIIGGTSGSFPGQSNPNPGVADGFIRKYDPDGNEVWTRQFGTSDSEDPFGVTVDFDGNLYISGKGFFFGGFIRKYNANGQDEWIQETPAFGSTLGIGQTGQVYLAGGTNNVLSGQVPQGGYDAFVQEYDTNGNMIWTRQFGTSSNDEAIDIAIDSFGNLYLGGYTRGSFIGYVNSGLADAFIAKLGLPNQPPTANAGVDQVGSEGTPVFFDGSASSDPDGTSDIVSYIWNFGDGTTGSGTIVNHAYIDNDVYTATLTVTDSAGATSTDTAIVTINNVAPMVGEITAPLDPQQVGTAVNVSANFTDPGVLDTHSAVWDFGDGTTSPGTITEINGSGSVAGNHTYITSGVYALTLTITDKDGGSNQNIFQYIVVYDPNGGFVTGGGWINSPTGAYAIVPSLSGKVNFGFVSKYQNGANMPTGNTKFLFSVADFSFQSTSYDWLTVSGPKAQYKGSGTINGSGDYGFLLTANDGQVNGGGDTDKFRLKVWDKTTGGIIYDNQMNENDNADASTTLGDGSIVIHN